MSLTQPPKSHSDQTKFAYEVISGLVLMGEEIPKFDQAVHLFIWESISRLKNREELLSDHPFLYFLSHSGAILALGSGSSHDEPFTCLALVLFTI